MVKGEYDGALHRLLCVTFYFVVKLISIAIIRDCNKDQKIFKETKYTVSGLLESYYIVQTISVSDLCEHCLEVLFFSF